MTALVCAFLTPSPPYPQEMLSDYFIQLQCRQQLLNIVVDNEEARLRLTLDLGSSYTDLHEYGTAMPLLEEALAGFNKLKGGSGKVTLLCLHTLAVAHMRMGEVAKSIELGEKALKGREKVLGANHQDTLRYEARGIEERSEDV